MSAWSVTGMTVAGLLALGVLAGTGSNGTDDDVPWIDKNPCHEAVKDQLRAPATANFHGEMVTKGSYGRYEITGEVDAQNGFGALLTASFSCTVYDSGMVSGTPVVIPTS